MNSNPRCFIATHQLVMATIALFFAISDTATIQAQEPAKEVVNRRAFIPDEKIKGILTTYASQAAHRFKYLNKNSKISLENLEEKLTSEILEISKVKKFPDNFHNDDFRMFLGHEYVNALYEEAFENLRSAELVTKTELDRFIKDLQLVNSYYNGFNSKVSVYALLQYIPLTSKQRNHIYKGKGILKSNTGMVMNNVMSLTHQKPISALDIFDFSKVDPPLQTAQKQLLDKLIARDESGDAPFSDLRLRLPNGHRQPNSEKGKPLLIQFLKDYFHTQARLWEDEFALSVIDVKKLNLISRQSVEQLIAFYSNLEKVNSLSAVDRMMLSQVAATHVSFSDKKWLKMLEKISDKIIANGNDADDTPLRQYDEYDSLVSELNLDFTIITLSVFGPEMGAQNQSNGLAGDQIMQIKKAFAGIKDYEGVPNFPDFHLLRKIIIEDKYKFENILTEAQMGTLSEMGKSLDMDVRRPGPEGEVQLKEIEVEVAPANDEIQIERE